MISDSLPKVISLKFSSLILSKSHVLLRGILDTAKSSSQGYRPHLPIYGPYGVARFRYNTRSSGRFGYRALSLRVAAFCMLPATALFFYALGIASCSSSIA